VLFDFVAGYFHEYLQSLHWSIFLINGETIISAIPSTIPMIPTGGMNNNQMLTPRRQNPRIEKKQPPRDSTFLEPHLGHGSQTELFPSFDMANPPFYYSIPFEGR